MYKKVLVTLDGSALSEIALEHVKAIAKGCNVGEVVLFRVLEPIHTYAGLGEDWYREADKRARTRIQDYLAQTSAQLKKEGITAKTVMAEGDAAGQILDYTSKNKVDLIIMSTHGSSGVVRWMLGSVADRVVRHAQSPVLLISAKGMKSST